MRYIRVKCDKYYTTLLDDHDSGVLHWSTDRLWMGWKYVYFKAYPIVIAMIKV